jgi:hypothetical protein
MSDFNPYELPETYKVILTKEEALLIQRIRKIGYGSLTAHVVKNRIVRTEEIKGELTIDAIKNSIVTIALEKL